MNKYRKFTTSLSYKIADTFVITELGGTDVHPMNWSNGITRETAWRIATAQDRPVVFIGLDGERKDLGVVFDPASFEQSAYDGYVGYGHSMSDGYYAPIDFDSWVKGLRRDPTSNLSNGNDCSAWVRASLPSYLASLSS